MEKMGTLYVSAKENSYYIEKFKKNSHEDRHQARGADVHPPHPAGGGRSAAAGARADLPASLRPHGRLALPEHLGRWQVRRVEQTPRLADVA